MIYDMIIMLAKKGNYEMSRIIKNIFTVIAWDISEIN